MSLLPLVRPLYSLLSVAADPLLRVLDTKGTVRTEPQTAASLAEEEEESGEDLQALLEVGEAEGIIEEDERELLETVVEFGETRALEIMTPRTDIRALPFDATVKDARDLMITEKYSRLPVYRGTMDNIEGIVYMRDLLNSWREGRENAPITDLLRPAFCVPETKPVNELLKDMQTNHVHLVIVIDEYGGVAGVVSTEDILEELVGEIEDEDTEKAETIEITAGLGGKYFDAIGSAEIEKIEELLEVEIGGDEFTTIAGFVTSEVGYVPKKGERFNVGGLDVEILDSDEKRIHLLRLRKSAENELAIKQSDEKEKSVSG
jgi:CBS domain containing-hemolysin-like protein